MTYSIDSDGVLTEGMAIVGITDSLLGSDTATITWTSQTKAVSGASDYKNNWSQYQDLLIMGSGRGSYGTEYGYAQYVLNDDNTNYHYWTANLHTYATTLRGYAANQSSLQRAIGGDGSGAGIPGGHIMRLHDINGGMWKQATGPGGNCNDVASFSYQIVECWRSTEAITKILIKEWSGGNLLTGSRFQLYGILPKLVQS